MKKTFLQCILLTLLSSYGLWHQVMAQDSVRVIKEVTVKSNIRYHETIAPQTLKGKELQLVNAHTVADALRFMSGVQMKDYGGIGGLKTVNLRSMGSQHVGIYYDGIELGNAQNGVIDLGQLSLDNVEEVCVYQGQRSAIMQTASDFANAGSVYIQTCHRKEKSTILKIQTGSSNLLRISSLLNRRISENLWMNLNVEGLSSNGEYRFEYRRRNYDGSIAYDTTATRHNGDVQALRGELNLFGNLYGGLWDAKVYTYLSNRGIPGAIVNNVWRRGERQTDSNTFAQSSWQRDISKHWTLRLSGKYANYYTHYLNKDTTQLMVDNQYRQQEAYVSLISVIELFPWWSLSLSYDSRWNYLSSDLANFAYPTRWSHLGALATAMDLGRLQLQGSIVCSEILNHTRLKASSDTQRWTPALFLSYALTTKLKLSGFAKRNFRMPTLNDLYYTNVGNALLKPETALQYDLGFDVSEKFSIHCYHNSIHDKIVAYPKGQQFRWTMLNLGKVHIDGIDVNGETSFPLAHKTRLAVKAQYTYQYARDVTDSNNSYYGDQIPYTPWHSGSATALLTWNDWDLAYNFVYTGERYCQQENIDYNHLQPWYTSDAHLAFCHVSKGCLWKATLEVNNLLNQQYDVIINYPMPGRNFNLTLQCEF